MLFYGIRFVVTLGIFNASLLVPPESLTGASYYVVKAFIYKSVAGPYRRALANQSGHQVIQIFISRGSPLQFCYLKSRHG
jgi:hypothetical protein